MGPAAAAAHTRTVGGGPIPKREARAPTPRQDPVPADG